jgi:hypothetical protein
MRKKVVIMGGGIGGLACAHELAKLPDSFEVVLLEHNSHLGGQAAELDGNSPNKHTALCWHAISSSYTHFLNIMDEILDKDNIKLISYIRPLTKFIYAMDNSNHIELDNSFVTTNITQFLKGYKKLYRQYPPFKDIINILYLYLRANTICEEKLEYYDKFLWKDFIGKLSPKMKRWVLDSTSIYLGMDYNHLSTNVMLELMRKVSQNTQLDSQYVFYSFAGSMYNLLYKPWKTHLENRGVKILLNHEVTKIYHIDGFNTISSVDIINKTETHTECHPITKVITADNFVNAMDTKNIAKLYPINDNTGTNDFMRLHNLSSQIQTQVLYYLPYRLQPIGTAPTILIFPDSPWFLMIRIEGDIWETNNCDLLSCGIGIFDVRGLNGKTASICTREELAIECWDQIRKSKHNLKLSEELPKWNIWKSFDFNEVTCKFDTYEPKFSNNINTWDLRPDFNDKGIKNLFHATSYAKTFTNIYNMEGAAEAGFKVAKLIIAKSKDDPVPIYKKDKPFWFFRWMQYIDKFIHKLKKYGKN